MDIKVQDQYFATLPKQDIGDAILDKVELYGNYLNQSGLMTKWLDIYKLYYNSAGKGAHVYQTGSQNEYRNLNVNHFRSVLVSLQNLISQQRPAFDAKAINSDVKSQSQCIVANQLLEYYMTEKELEDYVLTALESSICFGEGWVSTEWEVGAGKQYGTTPNGAPIFEGDLKYGALFPCQVARDVSKMNVKQNEWYITTTFVNRWNLAAKYPELEDKIKKMSISNTCVGYLNLLRPLTMNETDDIPVYTFYHHPTQAVPNGRFTQIIDNDAILYDGPMPYDFLPLHRISTMNFLGTGFGYTIAYDLMACQEALHGLDGSIITNQLTFGVQNVLCPRGSATATGQMSGGLNLIEYDSEKGKPEALQLCATPVEIFNYRESLVRDIETLSGINSTVRGDPSSSLKSGTALALVESQAIQFSQGLQKSYMRALASIGTATVNILKTYAKTPREIAISGKANRFLVQQFQSEDLVGVSRVQVDVGNPLSKTLAGRTQMAQDYLQAGFIAVPSQYEQVLATGRLEPLYEGTQMELILIRQENEDMVAGLPIKAIVTDDHISHIMEHKSVLASPDARRNPDLIGAALNHIQEHIDLLKSSDPALMSILHQPQLGQPMQQPQGQPGQETGQVLNPTAPSQQAADQAQLPSLPKNPMSGVPNQ